MRRTGFAIAATTMLVGISLAATAASAAPSTRTTITLACDRETTASAVTVSLTDSLAAPNGVATLACGPESASGARRIRLELATPTAPTNVHVDSWTWSVGSDSGTCGPTDGPLPFKMSCNDANGTGASLTIR
jgi:hypothetical protein